MDKTLTEEIEVRWADLDAYLHVNNVAFFGYLETARVKFLMATGLDFVHGPLQVLVVRAECDYKEPIPFPARIFVSVEISHIGNSSFDIHYNVYNGEGNTCATAKTVMVCYSPEQGKPVPVPEELKLAVK